MSHAVYSDNGADGDSYHRNLLAICPTEDDANALAQLLTDWVQTWPTDKDEAADEDSDRLSVIHPLTIAWAAQAPIPVSLARWSCYFQYTFDIVIVRDWTKPT